MGLDNGVTIKIKKNNKLKKEIINSFGSNAEHFYSNDTYETIEVCYWRKCWNIRAMFLFVLADTKNDLYEYRIKPKHIDALIRNLHYMQDRRVWEKSNEFGSCIWEYDEIINNLKQQERNLRQIKELFKKHPKLYVGFYDSY